MVDAGGMDMNEYGVTKSTLIKEKLTESLGVFGVILFYIISLAHIVVPLAVFEIPFWAKSILLFVMMMIPFLGGIVELIVWVWAFIIVINAPITIWSIIFFIIFGLYLIFILLPPVISFAFGIFSKDK